MRELDVLDHIEVLALTIWGEARGESTLGRAAVACVIINRVDANSWYGKSIKDVCLKAWQFSVWNEDDPNREKMLSLSENDPLFIECKTIAELAAHNNLSDQTRGATHYHTDSISPNWADNKTSVMRLGSHVFYNNID